MLQSGSPRRSSKSAGLTMKVDVGGALEAGDDDSDFGGPGVGAAALKPGLAAASSSPSVASLSRSWTYGNKDFEGAGWVASGPTALFEQLRAAAVDEQGSDCQNNAPASVQHRISGAGWCPR